jgi:hypothetical protein
VVANAGTKAFAGTGLWKFATEGWLTDVTPAAAGGSGNSWTLSAYEIFQGIINPDSNFGQSSAWSTEGIGRSVRKNWNDYGAMAIGTVIAAPIAAKLVKRIARGPIRDANKLLKWTGVGPALGVKV